MKTEIIDDDAFDEIAVSLECLEPQETHEGNGFVREEETAMCSLASVANNDQMTLASVNSSMLESIVSGAIESIAMLSMDSADIHVENLTTSDVGKLISDTIKQPPSKIKDLADIVHHKTGGNVLLVIQFIKSVWEEGLVRYSSRLKAWKWDIELIKSKKVLDDAATVMAQKISCLPHNTKSILEKMACLGCQCEESILRMLVRGETELREKNNDNGITLLTMLEVAIQNGLVDRVGSKIRFTHDQIQNAAYLGIPTSKRELWHLRIGQLLLVQCSGEYLENTLFVIVDQINRGKSFIKDEAGLICLAKLNCRAGEKAMSSFSFSSAAAYLKTGIGVLEDNSLKVDSSLLIKMHALYSEAEYCNGNFDEMNEAQEFVFTHAGCLDDKLSTYHTLILALSAQDKSKDAIDNGLYTLAQLGEEFPDKPDDSIIIGEFFKTMKMLKEGDFTALSLKRMNHARKIYIMEVLESLSLCAFHSKQEFLPLFVFRMIKLTLSHGLCANTPFCFAAYSMLLCGPFKDLKGADSYGKLALEIMETVQAEQEVARVHFLYYDNAFQWNNPMHLALEPLLDAHHQGLKAGDNHYSLACAGRYCAACFYSGKLLSYVKNKLQDYLQKTKRYKQDVLFKAALPMLKTLMILMGEDEKSNVLDWTEFTYKSLQKETLRKNDAQQIARIYFNQMTVAYLFGNYELAAEVATKNRGNFNKRFSTKFPEICLHAFYEGLTSLALARKTREDKWIKCFETAMEKLQKLAETAPFNAQHKVLLLEAEYAFLIKDDAASAKYDAAVAMAGKNGFIQDQALAYERAGIYYLASGNEPRSIYYFGQAHSTYLEWGAKGKADHICASYPI